MTGSSRRSPTGRWRRGSPRSAWRSSAAPPAMDFFPSHGFSHVYTEMRSILDLSHRGLGPPGRDGRRRRATATGSSTTRATCPTTMLDGYAEAKQVRRQDPGVDLDLRPSSYDAAAAAGEPDLPARARPHAVPGRGRARTHRAGGRPDRAGGAGPAPDPGRPVRHGHRAGAQRLRPGPGHQGTDAARAAGRRSRSCARCRPGTRPTASSCSRSTRSWASSPTGSGASTRPTRPPSPPAWRDPRPPHAA